MNESGDNYCYKCIYSTCKADPNGTTYYWCSKQGIELGTSLNGVTGCEKYREA
jgi:hypothetical protein